MRNEMRLIGLVALQRCKALMEEQIYSIPEDRDASGKPKWVRTRDLYNGERLVEHGAYEFAIENHVPYAEYRHEANKPGRRRINPARTSHWRDDMIRELTVTMPAAISRLQLQFFSRVL